MNVAIVGFGIEGKAAFSYWSALGATITICDEDINKVVPDGIASQLGPDYLQNLERFDIVFRTNGIHPDVLLRDNPTIADKVTTSVNEFLRVCPTKNVIGVTGTKGKGTTSTLIAKMLEAAGKTVRLGGNIGISAFDLLPELLEDAWVVLELSSFQLIDLHYSPHIAVCLMVVPEHLNWHKDMAEYVAAKSQLFKKQIESDIAIYFPDNEYSRQIAGNGRGQKIPYYANPGAEVVDGTIVIDGQTICATTELKLLGKHNWQNACAAITTAWQATHDVPAIRSVLTTFSGLEHRLEFVREIGGVKYYDDSFGTTPETTIVALQAFTQPKVVILGGSDKGVSFDELAQIVATTDVRVAVLIGDTAPKIEAALHDQGFTNTVAGGATMPEMVAAARAAARPGDIVLLSTACASFGLFESYKDRGDQFKAAVQALV